MHRRNGAALSMAPSTPGYWHHAPALVLALFAVVAVRLHEFVPFVRVIKPVLLLSILGTAFLFTNSGPVARAVATRHPLSRLILAYFLWMLVTVPFALWQGLAFSTARGFLPGLLMFGAVLLCAPTRENLDRLQTGFVVFVLIYAIYAQTFGQSWDGRISIGGMYDSNDMASLMALGFPLSAGLLTRATPGRARTAAILAVVALGLGIIATGSRGGTLALMAGAAVFALGFRGGRGLTIVLALVALGAAGWATAPQDFRDRMMSLTNIESDYNYTSQGGRKAVWARGRSYIRENPVFGVGAGNFPIAEGPGLAERGLTGKWSAAHNAYIQSYAELGLAGGTIFVSILLLGVSRARRLWRVPPGARGAAGTLDRPEFLASLAAFAAGGYFLSHAYFLPAFGLLGMIALADVTREAETAAPAAVGPLVPPVRRNGERGGLAAARVPVLTRGS